MHAHSNRSVRGIGVDPFFSGVERGKWTISVDNNNGSRAIENNSASCHHHLHVPRSEEL